MPRTPTQRGGVRGLARRLLSRRRRPRPGGDAWFHLIREGFFVLAVPIVVIGSWVSSLPTVAAARRLQVDVRTRPDLHRPFRSHDHDRL